MNYRWITDDGMTIWINGHGRIIKDAGGTPFFILGRISDQLLRKWYNPLTGLFNKNKFVADYREHTIAPFTRFMLINIDNLSHINLKYGRKYGDEMLCILANALSEKFSNHVLYHMEKDHFAVLLNTEDENEIRAHVEDIRAAIGDKVGFSVAIVPIEKKYYIDADSIFEYAQHLIKNNKSQGEGAITFFTEEDFAKALSTFELVVELEKSIYQNNFEGFFLVYQPQIDAKTHKVVSAEALLRYKSPQKGLVFPNDFIPLLERTQMIYEVGIWVLDCALAQCKQWRKRLPDLRISVNLSPVQLNDETIADKILNTIKKHDLPTNVLTLELTECMELEETALYSECFAKLRQAGVHIAIDDFGTGYSNLSYLKKVQADQLKIDQIFVKDVRQGTLNFTLISNIAKFAKTNGFSVCMEGVETVEELSVLELLSPDMLQGYIFSKPIVAEQFEAEYVLSNQPAEWSFKKDLIKQRERLRFAYFDATNILSQIKIGLWMLNINEQTGRGRLFADDTIKELFGMESIESHHDCFDFIVSRIPNEEKPNIMQMLKTMQEQADHRVVQLEYYWNHPTRGKILVRCTGKFSGAKDGVLMFEGFLRIIDDQYSMVK